MKTLKLTLCLLTLTLGAFAASLYSQIRETRDYEDACGDHWTLIIHYTDQGSAAANLTEKANHYEALIDKVDEAADC